MDTIYLENLDEFIYDESKIVTYKWLSCTLAVHVNQAKQMLYYFVEKQRNEKHKDLCVTYFLSGTRSEGENKVYASSIVPEEKLASAKAKLCSVTGCHVYSVSKTKVKDAGALFAANYDIVKENIMTAAKYSAIKCKQAQARSQADLEALQRLAQPTAPAPTFVKEKSEHQSSSSKKPAGIAGMFSNASKTTKKTEPVAETKSAAQAGSPSNTQNATSQHSKQTTSKQSKGAIANFFANQANKPKKETPSDNTCDKQKSPTQSNLKKKREESDDDDSPKRSKRRRVRQVAVSDSSSDEEQQTDMDLERIPTPPPPPPATEHTEHTDTAQEVTSPAKSSENDKQDASGSSGEPPEQHSPATNGNHGGRKRVKKLVNKSFVDDSGFMVTEKVMESCSESDNEIIPPTPPVTKPTPAPKANKEKAPTATKKASPAKRGAKQASLTSFFKRK